MRRLLLPLVLVAICTTASAQSPSFLGRLGVDRFSSAAPGVRDGDIEHLRKVSMWTDKAVIVADEAFLNHSTGEVEFRGKVVMRFGSPRVD
jgi:hypothetical protein